MKLSLCVPGVIVGLSIATAGCLVMPPQSGGPNAMSGAPGDPAGGTRSSVLDDKDNGVTSVAVSASTKRVTIDNSCKSLSST